MGHIIEFKRNELISYQVAKIISGHVVTRTWGMEGEIVNLGFWGGGDVVGTLLSDCEPYQIKCVDGVKIEPISKIEYLSQTSHLVSHIKQRDEMLRVVGVRPARDRVLIFLQYLADKFSETVKDERGKGRQITFPLTHQLLCESISLTRITVTKALSELEGKGLIFRQKSSIRVLD